MTTARPGFDAVGPVTPEVFRQVLGQYPTGVVVVTAFDGDEPIGMTIGSFTSVSLDPPLVAFLPGKSSSSWARLRRSGTRFCVNILSAEQEDVCRAVAVRKTDKFHDLEWHRSPYGLPVLTRAVAFIDCERDHVVDAGDHDIVIGRVLALDVLSAGVPLLFFRGGYGSFAPKSMAAIDPDLLDHLRVVDLARPCLADLAARFDTEVTSMALIGSELVTTSSVGVTDARQVPTRVGLRMPYLPPAGALFAALGGDEPRAAWLAGLSRSLGDEVRRELELVPDRVAERGFSITFSAEYLRLEAMISRLLAGHSSVHTQDVRAALRGLATDYNPAVLGYEGTRVFRGVSAPVFDAAGRLAYMVSLWGRRAGVTSAELRERIDALLRTAREASATTASATRPAG